MSPKRQMKKIYLIASLAAALVVSASVLALYLMRTAQSSLTAANTAPSVIIYAPVEGETAPADSYLLAQVTIAAQNPISRLELWLDGVLVDTQTPDVALGEVTTFNAVVQLKIPEGKHLFFARAVDSRGLIGQSLPISLLGLPLPATTEITAQEGQTLEDIAVDQGVDLNTLTQLNPNAGGGSLPGGSPVKIPAPGAKNPSGGIGPFIIPPAPLPAIFQNLAPLQLVNLPIFDLRSLIPMFIGAAPRAPSALLAGYENCTIRLAWMDNADNETGFNVWMQALGGPPKVIAALKGSPQTGPAWYEFASPITGIYSFWIEAQNGLGTQSSEIAWVGVTDLSCSPGVATQINIDMVDMFVNGGYDRVYCYLSVEGAPEKRVPLNDGQFIQLLGGWGDTSKWTGNGSSFLLPEPQDGEVTLEGKCLGWRGGGGPDDLGGFKASVPGSQWDGRRMELKAAGFTIGYRIQPHGAGQSSGFYTYTDYTIPTPSQPWITTDTSSDTAKNEKMARRPTLHWAWSGDSSKLTGFTIFLDGKFFRTVPNWQGGTPGRWEETFLLPSSCGTTYKFQVAANSGEAQSAPSSVYEYKQPLCEIYAEIKFETITFTDIDDHEAGSCDTAEMYGDIIVFRGRSIGFGNMDNTVKVGCGTYIFDQFSHADHHGPVSVSIDPTNPRIDFWALLWDEDDIFGGVHDHLCGFGMALQMPYPDWANYSKKFTLRCGEGVTTDQRGGYDAEGFVEFTVKGFKAPPGGP
ncbi:MAG: hypothetical protein ACC633_01375 [Anaerolineales bacterium]